MRKLTIEVILSRIEVSEHGCWIWQGPGFIGKGKKAYGKVGDVLAHRWSYEYFVGPIPVGMDLDHLCRCRACCNPDHLEPVSRAENLFRGARACRSIVCQQGHYVLGDNVYPCRRPGRREERVCRICELERCRLKYERRQVKLSGAT